MRVPTLTDEIDAVVAERHARGLEVLDLLRQAVTRQVDTVVGEAVGARAERVAVRTEGRLAEEVGRVLQRRDNLRAVEPTEPSTPR